MVFVVPIAVVALLGVVFVRNFTDFAVYYAAGRSLLAGRVDLYTPDFARGVVMDYRYLPFFILAFAPLALAPYALAAYIWHLLNTLAVAVCVWSIASLFSSESYSRWKVWTVVFLIVVPYFAMALDYGNAQLIVTALMFAAFSLSLRGRERSAAILLAIAIVIKIVPALALPYFVIKGQWRLLGVVLVTVVALTLVPSVYFGFSGNRDLVDSWYQHVIDGQEFHETNGPINVSLKGQLRRTFTQVDYTQRVDGDHNYAAVNVASLPRPTIDRAWLAISALSLAGGFLLIWWSSTIRKDVRLDALQFGLLLCLMMFVGPLTWRVYFIALLWPVAALGIVAWDHAPIRRILVVTAVVCAVLPLLPGRAIQRLLLVAGTDFYVACIILGLATFVLVHRTRMQAVS